MLKFFRTDAYHGLMGGLSPYMYKIDLWLRMTGVPHEKIIEPFSALLAQSPRGLVPFVELDGETIDDSTIILERLAKQHDDPLNDHRLTVEQHSQGILVRSLCEHELFYLMSYGRLGDERSDYQTLIEFNLGGSLPEEKLERAVEAYRASVLKRLYAWRIGRYEDEFIIKELRKCLGALSVILGDREWLFDDKPSIYDLDLFSMLAQIIHYPLRNPQVAIAREYSNLVVYCDRIRASYYGYDSDNDE